MPRLGMCKSWHSNTHQCKRIPCVTSLLNRKIYFKNKTAGRIEPCTSRAEPVRVRDGRAMSTFDSLSSLCRCRLIHSVFQFWPGYLNKTSCPELFFLRSRCDGSASAEGKNAQEAARTSSSGAGHPSF